MDILKLVESPVEMREAMELVKLWRYSSGQMDWQLAQILIGKPEPGLDEMRATADGETPSLHPR